MSREQDLQQAIEAAISGDNTAARKILGQVVQQDPGNARAWYLLSQVVDKPDEAIYCLQQVLRIQPDNLRVRTNLKKITPESSNRNVIEVKKKALKSIGSAKILIAIGVTMLVLAILFLGFVYMFFHL